MVVRRAIRFPTYRHAVYSHHNVQVLTLVLQDHTLLDIAVAYIKFIVCSRSPGENQELANEAAVSDSCVGL